MTYRYFEELVGEYINTGRDEEKLLGEIEYPAEIKLSPENLVIAVSIIAASADRNIRELIELSEMSAERFAEKFCFYRDEVQSWLFGEGKPDEWVYLSVGHGLVARLSPYGNNDKTGMRQGRLILLRKYRGGSTSYFYHCLCDCGNTVEIRSDVYTKSCGKCGMFVDRRAEALRNCGEFTGGTQLSKTECIPTAANRSGVVGVNWDKSRGKWMAGLRFQGHKYNLGRFDSFEDAVEARKKAEEKYFGKLRELERK